ncbi:DNA-processing protein DprA [Calothrix sp. NIES-2098]|uniref:DNA-processing protein DprA n=1 Tax=Calothrix sp. NIES-2098 TaxID=1954171 RepID=UPI000B6161D4|nr:putative Rossmann fold nucleotide-binding protein involved in DNA uptake [Calothrix sp. NIES-2098]
MQRLDTLNILTLNLVPGVGKSTLQRILNNLSFKPSNLKELYEVASTYINLTNSQLESAFNRAEQLLEEHDKAGIKVIGIDDPEFPQQLRTITNPPSVLYVKGDINCLKPECSVAVIGTRQPTDYGKRTAIRIAQRFAEQGLIVVGGLAQGCDTAGHQGCLDGKGCTVAVLAHGLDRIYPSENRELAQRIIEYGGCLVSEYPIGNKLFKNQFVERDRIQSGLSSAVVIIETDIKGGTMHTAKFCLEQGRVLACINYEPKHRSDKSRGNEKLIAEGKAFSLKNADDFKSFLSNVFGKIITLNTETTELFGSDIITPNISTKAEIVESQKTSATEVIGENNNTTIQVILSQEEKQKFEVKCAENGMTVNQVLHEFITAYLIDETSKTVTYPSQVFKEKNINGAEQLSCQLTLPIENLDVSQNKIVEIHQIDSNTNNALNTKKLAERLNVNPSTISKNKAKGVEFFKEWSHKKDPDGIAWEYFEKTKLFEVAF